MKTKKVTQIQLHEYLYSILPYIQTGYFRPCTQGKAALISVSSCVGVELYDIGWWVWGPHC